MSLNISYDICAEWWRSSTCCNVICDLSGGSDSSSHRSADAGADSQYIAGIANVVWPITVSHPYSITTGLKVVKLWLRCVLDLCFVLAYIARQSLHKLFLFTYFWLSKTHWWNKIVTPTHPSSAIVSFWVNPLVSNRQQLADHPFPFLQQSSAFVVVMFWLDQVMERSGFANEEYHVSTSTL